MADTKLTDKTANATLAAGDFTYIVDVSDTSSDAAGTGYKVLLSTLQSFILNGLTVSDVSDLTATATELNYTDGVTSNIQTQLDAKQATITDADDITEGATNLFLTSAERSKLFDIEASADVTDETNVVAALSGATLTGVTVATGDKVVVQDVSDSDNIKTVTTQAIADLATPEGTAIKSTGEAGGSKFLREDGDGTCSWQAIPGGGDALTSSPLSQFASTTSSQLAGVISDETGSGALVFGTSPTLVTPALGTPSALVLTNATGLTTAGLASPTGADTNVVTGTAGTSGDLATWNADGDIVDGPTPPSGTIVGTSDSQTLTNKEIVADVNTMKIATEIHSTSDTLTAAECYGKVHYVSSAATLTLPAVAAGMHLTVATIGAVAVSVDPNASDKIYLDGTALDDGDKITNLSTAGDVVTLTYYSADGWYASTNGWTDGGA